MEREDPERFGALKSHCGELLVPENSDPDNRFLFRCGAGLKSFTVGWDGLYRICLPLVHPDFVYDLRKGSLAEAWNTFTPRALSREARKASFLGKCAGCPIVNLCMWCPAQAWLETGDLEGEVEYFCRTAGARAAAIK